MAAIDEQVTGSHAKGWISAANPRLHHIIDESKRDLWTECWLCWLAALRDTPGRGPCAVERLAADNGREGVVLDVSLPESAPVQGLLKAIGNAVSTLAGGGTPNGDEAGCRVIITPSDPPEIVEREVRHGEMVVMRDGHLTPEFLGLSRSLNSEENLASELAEYRDIIENGGGVEFADFFPTLLQELEGQ